ncbi:hypothetical protein CKF54_08015 [Psittacicella hinzii]|uniref:Fucosyltransferase C-terminal domain-containing protein n=1 Tax=Psittacicella hinzii TaxID=2028575 RepID=A0A3A1Y171_9GAMM|nr:glycosyltransferase family 10 [Psittacicella hinzii]RIY31039.1 hypothetical protein CKF54_08015 [Psittacicella hinzii]
MADINHCGYWLGFSLEKQKSIFLYHKFDLQKLPHNLFLVSGFLRRFWTQSELERRASGYQEKLGWAPLLYHGYPYNAASCLGIPYKLKHGTSERSFYYDQEHSLEFAFSENSQDIYADYLDLALGIYLPEVISTRYCNYYHAPNYLVSQSVGLNTLYGLPTYAQVEAWIESFEQARRQAEVFKRPALSVCISRHDSLSGLRGVRGLIGDLFTEVTKDLHEAPVFYAGYFRNNTSDLHEHFNDDKIAYGKNFVFMICPENSYCPGYVSEKILEAFASGCIPIYWGGIESELDYFNEKAFVYFDPRKPKEFQERIRELVYDQGKLEEMIAQPCFLPGAAARIYLRYIYPIAVAFSNLMDGLNPYQLLKEPVDTTLEQEKAKAEAVLAQLGLVENKYQGLDRLPFKYYVDFEQYNEEEKQRLEYFVRHYNSK